MALHKYGTWRKRMEGKPLWPEYCHIVAITWDDATYSEDVENSGLARATTFGVVVEITSEYVKIAAETFCDGSVRDVNTIPVGMIAVIHNLGGGPVVTGDTKRKGKRR